MSRRQTSEGNLGAVVVKYGRQGSFGYLDPIKKINKLCINKFLIINICFSVADGDISTRGCAVQKNNTSIFKMLFYFSLLFVNFI